MLDNKMGIPIVTNVQIKTILIPEKSQTNKKVKNKLELYVRVTESRNTCHGKVPKVVKGC